MRLWVAATIIACVVAIGFFLSAPRTSDRAENTVPSVALESIPEVAMRDVYKKGTHTITGSLLAPNVCTVASAVATLQGAATSTESILVEVSMPVDEGVCLQVPTRVVFQTTIAAPDDLPLVVTVNGSPATTSAP